MFLTSIKTYEETIQIPMKFLPEIPQWVNFSIVSDKLNFPQLYLNTILVTIMMIVGQILIVTICAYAFDRLNFPGKNVLFMGMLALMMVPGQIFIIPRFKLMVNLGLTNTLVGLVLPGLFNIFGVFLMRQFFSTLPRELDEAARIDGCSYFRTYWNVLLPPSEAGADHAGHPGHAEHLEGPDVAPDQQLPGGQDDAGSGPCHADRRTYDVL